MRDYEIPDDLYYSIENHMWAKRGADGSVTVGLAEPGCEILGEVAVYSPKRVGKEVRKGFSCATLESGDWVEPARSPVSGVVAEVNEAAMEEPGLISSDPYGRGWLVRLTPDDWEADRRDLLTGLAAVDAFERQLAERD